MKPYALFAMPTMNAWLIVTNRAGAPKSPFLKNCWIWSLIHKKAHLAYVFLA